MQSVSFWSNFDANLPNEDGRNQKQATRYRNNLESKSYLLSTFNENYNYFLLYLDFFWVWLDNGPRAKD